MTIHTGNIEAGDALFDLNSRGGKITYIRIGGKTFQRVGCPQAVFSFMRQNMNARLYMHYIPLMGNVILGVKDVDRQIKMMGRVHEILASCIMVVITLGLYMIIPAVLIGNYLNNIKEMAILFSLILPSVVATFLLIGYIQALSD